MSRLSNRLHAWALNNEMIDTHFTEHGCDCVSASELLVQQDAEIERLREELLARHNELRAKAEEIERLRKERDSAFQTWKEMHVATLDGFIKQHHEPLKAEIKRLQKELAEKDEYIRTISRPVGAHSYE